MTKYALLFAGCYDEDNRYDRYENDIGYMHEVIVNKYNYNIDDISVLYCDGRDFVYNNITYHPEPATYINLLGKLFGYVNKLDEDDTLLIMISNHGDIPNSSYSTEAVINTWGKIGITQKQFANVLSLVKSRKIILLAQCYGGNFLEECIQNSIIISANFKGMLSYALDDCTYEEFLYHFISYYNDCYPNGTSLKSSNTDLSIQSAFNYAKTNDSKKVPVLRGPDIFFSVPQMKCYDLDPNLETI